VIGKFGEVASSDAAGGRESIWWWACPVLLAGVALAFDAADRRIPFSILISGLVDEPAHLVMAALGLLVLACFIEVPRRFYVAALVASVAIDLDHIPLFLGLLGSPRRMDALANPGDGVDRQLLVVPWNDHLTYSRPADPRKHRGPRTRVRLYQTPSSRPRTPRGRLVA
jgi:hypothetical protein